MKKQESISEQKRQLKRKKWCETAKKFLTPDGLIDLCGKNVKQAFTFFRSKNINEAESVLVDSKLDELHISFWTNKNDAYRIFKRCGKYVIEAYPCGDGVQLRIHRDAFRGFEYAFKLLKEEGD